MLIDTSHVGLIASAAGACSIKHIGRFEPLILMHQQNAIKALKEALSDGQCLDDTTSAIFAVKTLLLIAVSVLLMSYEIDRN